MKKPQIWSAEKTLGDMPLGDRPVVWNYLAHGEYCSVNLVRGRDVNMPHVHDNHDEVLYVLEGRGPFLLGDERVNVQPGDILFVPAGTVHTPLMKFEAMLSVYSPPFDPDNPDRRPVEVEEE